MFLFPKIQMSYYYSFIFKLVWPKPTIQVQLEVHSLIFILISLHSSRTWQM